MAEYGTRARAMAAIFVAGGSLLLAGCNTDGSARIKDGYVLKDMTLSDGTVYSPQASPDSDCEAVTAEVAKMEEIIKPDFETFIAKGKGELAVGLFYSQMKETAFFCSTGVKKS